MLLLCIAVRCMVPRTTAGACQRVRMRHRMNSRVSVSSTLCPSSNAPVGMIVGHELLACKHDRGGIGMVPLNWRVPIRMLSVRELHPVAHIIPQGCIPWVMLLLQALLMPIALPVYVHTVVLFLQPPCPFLRISLILLRLRVLKRLSVRWSRLSPSAACPSLTSPSRHCLGRVCGTLTQPAPSQSLGR